MIIQNTVTKTSPLAAHAQGHVHATDRWIKIVDSLPLVKKETLSPEITIVSFFALDKRMALREQLEASGIPVINLANPNIKFWRNPTKIKLLANLNVSTKYTMCLDGLDILLAEDLSDLIPRFNQLQAAIVYNASKINYPNVCVDVEPTIDKKNPFKYLNAGAFIGKTNIIINFYRHLLNTELHRDYGKNSESEQIRVRNGRLRYDGSSQIKVDTNCSIFQTLNRAEFEYNNQILKITS